MTSAFNLIDQRDVVNLTGRFGLSTILLTALRVSNTPSPVTATASKYGARSTHSPVGI